MHAFGCGSSRTFWSSKSFRARLSQSCRSIATRLRERCALKVTIPRNCSSRHLLVATQSSLSKFSGEWIRRTHRAHIRCLVSGFWSTFSTKPELSFLARQSSTMQFPKRLSSSRMNYSWQQSAAGQASGPLATQSSTTYVRQRIAQAAASMWPITPDSGQWTHL